MKMDTVGLYEDTENLGPAIQTRSGGKFHVLNPSPDEVNVEDIAHALANICRYTGHCYRFYSVAEHSVMVSYHVPKHQRLAALLHDAHEAYLGDTARPLKFAFEAVAPSLLHDIEDRVNQAISLKLGVDVSMTPEIKAADNLLLATEKRDLMPPGDWPGLPEPLARQSTCWQPTTAKHEFLNRYAELGGI